MIDQVEITPSGKFEMIPKLGDQIVVFGDASNHQAKLEKLKLFYKKVMPVAGWNKYSVINLSFDNQVVAKVRSKEEVKTDSLRTLELMKMVAEYTEKMAGDTLFAAGATDDKVQDMSMVLQSVQRDEAPEVILPAFDLPEVIESDPAPATVLKKTAPVKKDLKSHLSKPPITKTPVKKPVVKKAEPVKKSTAASQEKPGERPKAIMKKPETRKPNNDY
jgi:hypothetical protein